MTRICRQRLARSGSGAAAPNPLITLWAAPGAAFLQAAPNLRRPGPSPVDWADQRQRQRHQHARPALREIRVPQRGLGRPRTRPHRLLGDKGYSSAANRRLLTRRGIAVTIPERADQLANRRRKGHAGGRPHAFDPTTYKRRNVVERCFNRFKQWRAIATRYDNKALNYRAGIVLASVILWLKP